MRRRITTAIVGVTACVLLALGIPLAIVAQRQMLDSEVVELQASAAKMLTEIEVPIDPSQLAEIGDEPDASPDFAVYDTAGTLIFGRAPAVPDGAVVVAAGGTTSSSTSGEIVVATPITDRDEALAGVLRLRESLDGANSRARRAWLIMAIAGASAIGVAWVIGTRLARRLSRPLTDLAASAAQLGHGGVLAHHDTVGIPELDLLGTTLVDGSQRVSAALARERRFSADVSHQLRTPLAALRLKLEAAAAGDAAHGTVPAALGDLERLESTVDHLLTFARDAIPTTSTSSIRAAAESASRRWASRAAVLGRSVTVVARADVSARAAQASVDQILDVLIDNAITHGRGAVTLTARAAAGGAALDVTDEGSTDDLFCRGQGTNHGIGLALARSLAEAEGGRLLIVKRAPTTFSLILLEADD